MARAHRRPGSGAARRLRHARRQLRRNAKKAAKAEQNSHKIDVSKAGNVTLTVWDQEVRGGQRRQIAQLNHEFTARTAP